MKQQSKKKKKRSRVSKKESAAGNQAEGSDEKDKRVLNSLLEACASVSLEEEAARDHNKAAETLIKNGAPEDSGGTMFWGSCGNYDVGSSSGSNTSEVIGDVNNILYDGLKQKNKQRKAVASAGTVSTLLGKDYVRSVPKKSPSKLKGFHKESWSKEEAEQFLCSMLGDDCELSLAVVSDVFCQCGYNLDKALDVLLELSSSSREQANGYYEFIKGEDAHDLVKSNSNLIGKTSKPISRPSDTKIQDNIWFTGNRNPSQISESTVSHRSAETGNLGSELPHKVLESLFNMPTPKTAEHEPNNMNWRNVVKKLTSLGQRFEPGDLEQEQLSRGDEYRVLRGDAQQHWNSMKSYYREAATAFTIGEKEYASYLSDKGRLQNKMAREADEKASQNIFNARNRSIENMITIDLHGQHIKQAMKLLKLHLLFGAYAGSVRSFRVITGCGSHGVGKSKLKSSVVNLLQKEGISWSEENRGTLLIKLNGQTEFSFLDSETDSD